MKFTKFVPVVLAATLLVGCAATPQADASVEPSSSASSSADTGAITSSSRVTSLDDALAFAATITPDMSSAKYEIVNTSSKLLEFAPGEVSDELFAKVQPELEAIVADAKASVTRDELVTQIEALEGVVAQIETARA
ncbi:MAG: hypothetical protein KDB08_05965 [Microthrixaceae bacterium]|nr:hypothetical protein [Microthrixaceae bacterium]